MMWERRTDRWMDRKSDILRWVPHLKIDNPNQSNHVLLPHEIQHPRRVAGQLNGVSTQTRPDMAYTASMCVCVYTLHHEGFFHLQDV